MDILDDCIRQIRDWFLRKEEAGNLRRFEVDFSSEPPGRKDGVPKIIFKEDTKLELGHPSAGSCSATLATHDSSLVESGMITLVGPDVGETERERAPFAQIAIARCEGNVEDACSAMDRILHASAQTDGYMLRSVPNMIWARVSKEAAESGFSLRGLGSRLLAALNAECPDVGGVEIFFVTETGADVAELNEIVAPARNRLRKIQAFGRKEDGTYECDTSLDCSECPEKPVCDTIRDVITIRKGDRVITIGGDED